MNDGDLGQGNGKQFLKKEDKILAKERMKTRKLMGEHITYVNIFYDGEICAKKTLKGGRLKWKSARERNLEGFLPFQLAILCT
jgi:hypothetical protein